MKPQLVADRMFHLEILKKFVYIVVVGVEIWTIGCREANYLENFEMWI